MATDTIPSISDEAIMSVPKAARLLAIGNTTAYSWERAGVLRTHPRKDGKGRYTTGRDIRRAWRIHKGLATY